MKTKTIDQMKAEYQQSLRIAAEKRVVRDAANEALNQAQEALDAAEAKAEQQATDLFHAIRVEALRIEIAPGAPVEVGPTPIRAGNLKRGESIRLAPGQCLIFEGGAELTFPGGRYLTNSEVTRLAQTIREAKGGSSEPPPSTM